MLEENDQVTARRHRFVLWLVPIPAAGQLLARGCWEGAAG